MAQTLASLGFIGLDGLAIPGEWIAAIVLLAVFLIAVWFIWQFHDSAYGLVIVWAYAGIAIKEASTPLVPWIAGAGAIGIALLIVMRALAGTSARRSRGA